MIEEGLSELIQANAGVAAIAASGGFLGQLPKGTALPSWTYITATDSSEYVLAGPEGIRERRVQFDCYGEAAADVINLAKAIDGVLNVFQGLLPDPDSTRVQGCFRENIIDFPQDSAARTYRRMLEYRIWFVQP
jgi:hypothetical protein